MSTLGRVAKGIAGGIFVYGVVAATRAPTACNVIEALSNPVDEALADPQPGSRLKGKFTSGSDGSMLYRADVMYDAQRAEDCAYRIAADGVLRCLPVDLWQDWVFYSDAACTQPFIYWGAQAGCAATPPNAYATTVDAPPLCPGPGYQAPIHVYPIGGLIALPPAHWSLSQGMCIPQQQAFGNIAFSVGAEVAASSFVAGTPGIDP
jgi:hypothetical protein